MEHFSVNEVVWSMLMNDCIWAVFLPGEEDEKKKQENCDESSNSHTKQTINNALRTRLKTGTQSWNDKCLLEQQIGQVLRTPVLVLCVGTLVDIQGQI